MKLAEQVEVLRERITDNPDEVKSLERMKYRLSDAIREGATVSGQAFNWSDENDNMCAMSAAVVAAQARGYL